MSLVRWLDRPVVVRTPATSANLGPGFDSLGLALSLHDEIQAQVTASGLWIEVTGIGERTARFGEKHLVVRAMRAGFEAIGEQPPGIALRCENAVPHGFGLGSSAAAIVAGVLAARALSGERGTERLPGAAVLQLAADLEGHADNVAACLAGGLTIAWSSAASSAGFSAGSPAGPIGSAGFSGDPAGSAGSPAGPIGSARSSGDPAGSAGSLASAGAPGTSVRSARLEPLPGLTPVLCVPAVPLATEAARQVLPAMVPHADAARNAARSALLIAALTQDGQVPGSQALDAGALLDATEDFLHQPYRASSMPGTASLVGALRDAGIPAVVSGAGPAALALIMPTAAAGPEAVTAIAAKSGQDWTVTVLDVDREGATVRC